MSQRRTTKFAGPFSWAALALLVLPACVKADNAPDWMRAAAQTKLPEYSKETVAVVLFEETQATVKDNGEIETRTRRALKLLRPEARAEYDYFVVHFDNETKISFLKAWTITSAGKEMELKEKDATEVAVSSFDVFSDKRVKYLKFPEANPGSIVGYEVIQKQRPYLLDDIWGFQYTIPLRRSRFTVQLPPGWEFTTVWANYAEQKPQTIGANAFAWEVTDIPAIEIEPEMPPWEAVAGHMDVKYFPRDAAMRTKTAGSWSDLGAWYSGLFVPQRSATPAIQQKVKELTAGIQDPLEKIKALATFSQREIRYAAIEIGIGGHQPHAAGDVFVHRYGDCKDKATLLSAMLQEIGVRSYLLFINTERGVVAPEFPSLRFNHAILAIVLPDGMADSSLYAVLRDPKLGRLLFFDPTNEFVSLGYLPPYLQDTYGLVATPNGGELLTLPLLPASTNRLLRKGELNLNAAGHLYGEIQEVRWGDPAVQSREQFLGKQPADREKALARFLGNSLSSFTLTSASVGNLENYDESLTLDYKFTAEGYAKTAGNLLVVRPRVVGEKGSNILSGKPRKYPIEFRDATRQDDDFEITLPAGFVVDELPAPVNAECPYGSYRSEVKMDGNKLHYKRTYEIREILVPTQKLDEVRNFFHQIAADERSSAILRRAN
jgi:hypothetical protein